MSEQYFAPAGECCVRDEEMPGAVVVSVGLALVLATVGSGTGDDVGWAVATALLSGDIETISCNDV